MILLMTGTQSDGMLLEASNFLASCITLVTSISFSGSWLVSLEDFIFMGRLAVDLLK